EARPARPRRESECARAREEVDHPHAGQVRRPGGVFQDVEDRLPRPVRGRPRSLPLRRDQGLASEFSGYDAQASFLPLVAANAETQAEPRRPPMRSSRPSRKPKAGGRSTPAHSGIPSCAGHSVARSEEHTSELQSRENLVCRLLLEKKKKK